MTGFRGLTHLLHQAARFVLAAFVVTALAGAGDALAQACSDDDGIPQTAQGGNIANIINGYGGAVLNSGNTLGIGQTFVAPCTGQFVSFELLQHYYGGQGGTGPITGTADIYSLEGTPTIIAQAAYSIGVNLQTWQTITLNSPVDVVAGKEYAFFLRPPDQSTGHIVFYVFEGLYATGDALYGGSFPSTQTFDTAFSVKLDRPSNITVDTIADSQVSGDNFCSLREAILNANLAIGGDLSSGDCAAGTAGLEDIDFAIPLAGPHIISLSSALPVLDEPVVIDGYTQTGAAANTNAFADGSNAQIKIVLDGSLLSGADGLRLTGPPSVVRGLAITNFSVPAGSVRGIVLQSGGHTIEGNFLGTDASGTVPAGNYAGVNVLSSGNTIGGLTPASRNLISGNTYGLEFQSTGNDNFIYGNYIGTNAAGTATIGQFRGIVSNQGLRNLVGGADPLMRNLISGNNRGIALSAATGGQLSTAWVIRGNLIGTNAAGTTAIPNGAGIYLQKGADDNQILDNVLAFNGGVGVGIGVFGMFAPQGNTISQNSMHDNGGIGIDLIPDGVAVPGPNGDVVAPTLVRVDIDSGGGLVATLTAATTGTLEFFLADAGAQEGETFLTSQGASVGTATYGLGVAASLGVSEGDFLVATITNSGNTSEFSASAEVVTPLLVTSTVGTALGSLYQAALYAENVAGLNEITFDIPGAGPHTIVVANALPAFTQPVTINGLSQPGSTCGTNFVGRALKIEIEGSGLAGTPSGIQLNSGSDGSTIAGIGIRDFPGDGISIDASSNHTIACTHIGLNLDGNTASGNVGAGIQVFGAGATGIKIGGLGVGNGNIIAANGGSDEIHLEPGPGNSIIQGNRIGVDIDLEVTLSDKNLGDGNRDRVGIGFNQSPNPQVVANTIGGFVDAIQLANNSGAVIQGNFLGTNPAGTLDVGNETGVVIFGAGPIAHTIGGTGPGEGNILAYNSNAGVNVAQGSGISVRQNSFFANASGISLAAGTNNDILAPTIGGAVIDGAGDLRVSVSAPVAGDVEFYIADGATRQGETFLASPQVYATPGLAAAFSLGSAAGLSIVPGDHVTATITDASNNTSQFSLVVSVVSSPVTTSTNRTSFDAAFPALTVEDFEGANTGAAPGCESPLDENTNDVCYSPGAILPGLVFEATNSPASNGFTLNPAGLNGAVSTYFVAGLAADHYTINFSVEAFAAGMDLTCFTAGDVDISVYDSGGVLLALANSACNSTGSDFYGFSSPVGIGKIVIAPVGSAQFVGIDNLGFEPSVATNASDRAALVALYNATDGANWDTNTGWLVGDPVDWYGVTTAANRVSELSLNGNNLVGTLPTELGDLTALEILDLGANLIGSGIPGSMGGMVGLRELHLFENDLTGAIPSALGNAAALTTVRLYSNNLTGSIPSSLGSLAQLDRLNLDGNQLTGAIPASFAALSNLTFLSLTGNNLSGVAPDLSATSLSELYLGANSFSGTAPMVPVSIAHLVLSDNAYEALPDLSGASGLATLRVEGNRLDFDDLLPNPVIPAGTYSYAPQDVFGQAQSKAAVPGTSRVLSAPIAQANTYQWYKGGLPIANEDGLTLSLASVSASDAGVYTLQATNSSLGLTLTSDDISVSIAGDVEVPFGYVFETFADGFERPEGIAVDASGNILIADAQTGLVRRFDPSGAVVGPDPLISNLSSPVDLAVGANGDVYVAAADGVHRFPGASASVAGSPWLAGRASEIAFGPNGSLFVSRAEGLVNERIMRVRPADLATATATVYMTFPDAADWDPQGITWDQEGNQYVVARGVKKVLRVRAGQTTPIKASTQPVAFSAESANGAAFGADLKVYVATSSAVLSGASDAAVLTPFVEGLGGDGFNQVAVDEDGRLYIADGATGRVVRVLAPQQQTQDVVPVAFSINVQGLPGVNNGSDFTALQEAFDAWTSVSTSSVAFPASVPTTSIAMAGNDGTNVMTFVDTTFPMAPGVLAVAAKTLIVSGGGDPDVAEIVDVDVVFNPYYVNNPGIKFGTSTAGGAIPIGAVAAHELGHTVGLFHSGIPTATMWFALQPGNEALSLAFDDEARISHLYPGAGLNAFGTISGTLFDGEAYPEKVAGALVTGTHQTTGSQVSGYTDLAGEYILPRLTPGSWDVDIQPLDGDVHGFDLRPRNISAYHRAITHNTDFIPEFYTNGDSNSDPPSVSTPVIVTAGSATAGIDIVTNIDLTAPVVAGIFPLDLASAVATTESVALTFSEEIDPATLDMALLEAGVTPVSAGVVLEPGGILAILTPIEPLRPSTSYTVTVGAGLADIRGNAIASGFSASFITDGPDTVSPTVAQVTPENLTTGVFITDVVTVRFSESMDPLSITSTSFSLSSDGVSIDGEVTLPSGLDHTTAVFTPDGNFPEGTTIAVSLSTGVKDITGHALAAPFMSSFSTVAVQTPSILDVGPADLTTDVAVETPVLVDFDEPIAADSVNPLAVVFSPPVPGSYSLLLDNSRLLFQPSANLAYSTTYTVTVGVGLTDLTGNPLMGTEVISFTTSSAPALAPVIISASPPSAGPGADIVITGTGFSPIPASNVVTFGSVAASVRRASLTSIVAEVPAGADLGDLVVTIGGQASNAFPFFVVNSQPIHGDEVKIGASESGPSDVDVSPDGVKALVTYPSSNKVQEIDLGTTTVAGTVNVGDTPFKVAINPTGTRAYVTNFGDHTVTVLNLTVSPPTVQATIPVGLNPTGIAVAPDGSKVFVAQKTSQSVAVIDANAKSLAYNQTVNQVRLGSESGPEDVEAGPDGTKLYVGGAGGIYVIELDPASPDFESVKHVSESGTEDVEVSPDGTQLFAVTTGGFIQIVDINPNSASPYAVVNTSESGVEKVEVSPDGTQLFATTTAGVKVFAITYTTGTADAVTSLRPGLELIETLPVVGGAEGIALSPRTGTIVVANSGASAGESVSILEGILTEIGVLLPLTEPGPFTLTVDGTDTVLRASNGVEVLRNPVDGINNLRVVGTAEDDHLIIDFSSGSPTTGLAISFYGRDQGSIGDQLTVTGASSSDVEHVFYDEHTGQINVDGFGTINYFELEPVADNMDAVNRVFTLSAGLSQTVVLSGDGDGASGNGISFIDSDNGSESISFVNPTGTLAIVGDALADNFHIGPLDTPLGGLTSLTVTGGAAADSFLVRPSSIYPITVNGGSPSVCTGDLLTLDVDGISGAALTMTGPGMGMWTFDAPYEPITFTGIGSQPDADAQVELTLSASLVYTVDPGGVVLSLTNSGSDAASCVSVVIPDAMVAAFTGGSITPSDGTLSGSPLTWTIPLMGAGAVETLSFSGMVSSIMPEIHSLALSVGGTLVAAETLTTDPGFRFPAKAHINTAIETSVDLTVGGMPYSYNHLVVGLFQGSPGIDTSVWCSLPPEIPGLFEPPGYTGFWRPCGEGLPHPLHTNDLYEDDLGTLWLATWGSEGLYRSFDGGFSWAAVEPMLDTASNGSTGWVNVYAITQDRDGFLYISANNGQVFRSLNHGDGWQQVASLPHASADTPWSLVGHATRPGTVFAGTFGRGVYVTEDFGFTWEPVGGDALNQFLIDADAGHIFDLAFSPDDPDVLFAGTASGVFRGTPYAVTPTWTEMGPSVTLSDGLVITPEIRSLAFVEDASGQDDLLAGSWGFGVFGSDDPLTTVGMPPLALRNQFVVSLTPMSTGELFTTTRDGGALVWQPHATSTAVAPGAEVPEAFELDQNYPNPFNPSTTIRFGLTQPGWATLTVVDVLGRRVATLANGPFNAGYHDVRFDASRIPSGIYLYVIESAQGRLARSLILAK